MVTDVLADDQIDSKSAAVYEEMMKAGVFYGRKKSKTHPAMKKYVGTTRNGIELIDPEEVLKALESAGEFLKEKVKAGKSVLFVATQPAAKEAVAAAAKKFGFPYVVNRWLGGTLTNFKVIAERIKYWKKLAADREEGRFEKYTKKERLNVDREIERLTVAFEGIKKMERLPDVVFIIAPRFHSTALWEARRLKIPVVAVASTDADPAMIDCLIPANDNAAGGIKWLMEKLEKFIETGLAEREAEAAEEKV